MRAGEKYFSIEWMRWLHTGSIVTEVIETILSLFIYLFFQKKILSQKKHKSSKNQLTNKNKRTLNNKRNHFSRIKTFKRVEKLLLLRFDTFFFRSKSFLKKTNGLKMVLTTSITILLTPSCFHS